MKSRGLFLGQDGCLAQPRARDGQTGVPRREGVSEPNSLAAKRGADRAVPLEGSYEILCLPRTYGPAGRSTGSRSSGSGDRDRGSGSGPATSSFGGGAGLQNGGACRSGSIPRAEPAGKPSKSCQGSSADGATHPRRPRSWRRGLTHASRCFPRCRGEASRTSGIRVTRGGVVCSTQNQHGQLPKDRNSRIPQL